MTTPSPDRGAVSVEPMTDRFDRLRDRAREAQTLHHTRIDVRVSDLVDLLVHALPSPRRYTGGLLEDGLYLWRRPWWHATSWAAFAVEGGHRHAFMGPTLYSTETGDVWLIGPLPIPPIPESEEQSDG